MESKQFVSSDSQIEFSDPLEFQKTFQQCHKLHVNSFAINDVCTLLFKSFLNVI